MSQKIILLFLLLVFYNVQIFAQAEENTNLKRNAIGVKIGVNRTYLKDVNFSPLNYKGNSMALGLNYFRKTKKLNIFYANLDLSLGRLTTKASKDFATNQIYLQFNIGYLKRVNLSQDRLTGKIGGQFSTFINTNFVSDLEAITFYALYSADVVAQMTYKLDDRQSISTSLGIPLLGLLVRPPYAGWDKYFENSSFKIATRGKVSTINKFFALNWNLTYQYQLSNRWNLLLSNHFAYYRTKVPLKTVNVNNLFTVGSQLKF